MRRTQRIGRQGGVGLIEVLISMVILSLCLLGMVALQGASLRNNQSAQSRSMATIMSNSITDAMRANVTAARNGEYNVAMTCLAGSGLANSLAGMDQAVWLLSLKSAIGPTACGGISCQAGSCNITVQWDDSRATDGASAYSVTTRVQL